MISYPFGQLFLLSTSKKAHQTRLHGPRDPSMRQCEYTWQKLAHAQKNVGAFTTPYPVTQQHHERTASTYNTLYHLSSLVSLLAIIIPCHESHSCTVAHEYQCRVKSNRSHSVLYTTPREMVYIARYECSELVLMMISFS